MTVLCRVDAEQLSKIPPFGPLIIVTNHINFLEAPIIYTYAQPRPMRGFAKIETWDSPFLGPLFTSWDAIPVRRGEADMRAVRQAITALKQNHILCIAPEGTRSGDGQLQKGYAGVATMALLSGAPLLPVVHFGAEAYRQNLRRLRRTDFRIRVGQPFVLETGGTKATHTMREDMATEIMYQMATLLPPSYRGQYADLTQASQKYIRFTEFENQPLS